VHRRTLFSRMPANQGNTFTAFTVLMYDTPLDMMQGYACATERKVLGSEIWQFLIVIFGFFVVAVLWLFIVYLPGRTLERWEDQRPGRAEKKTTSPAGRGSSDGPMKPES
jgi:hypothetical protein